MKKIIERNNMKEQLKEKTIMNYTNENVMAVAQKIVDDMDLDDLMAYVYDDLCSIMDKDEELFHCNLEHFNFDEKLFDR